MTKILHAKINDPPNGYSIVTNGTTRRGDLLWDKDAQKYVPIDSVNEYCDAYLRVIRPDGQLQSASPLKPKAEPAIPPKRFETSVILGLAKTLRRESAGNGRCAMTDLDLAASALEETARQRDELAAENERLRQACTRVDNEITGVALERAIAQAECADAEKQRDELLAACAPIVVACEKEFGGPDCDEFEDDEAVAIGRTGDGAVTDSALSFGVIRRASAAIARCEPEKGDR